MNMEKAQHLPTTPSALIRAALADLRAIEADDGYVVDMSRWHWPTMDDRGQTVCQVCLAGAVMAQTLDVPHDLRIYNDDLAGYGCSVENKMNALDFFRLGEIEEGLDMLGYDVDKLSEEWQQYAYEAEYDPADPDKFHVQMLRRADYLASCGL